MPRHPDLDRKIGAAMRSLRKSRGLTDAEVAERMGYGPNGRHYVNRWERGERGISASLLWLYLQAIGDAFTDLDRALGVEPSVSPRLQEIARELQDLTEKIRG